MEIQDYYSDTGPERVGFILDYGRIVEVKNICIDPNDGFEVSAEDLIKYEDEIVGTWHTHPGASCNLSLEDYNAFLNWPSLHHTIVGNDGQRSYEVKDGAVIQFGAE